MDERTDLFSFGVLLCEVLTGAHPFKRESAAETTVAILREPPEIPDRLPDTLRLLVRRLLAKEAIEEREKTKELEPRFAEIAREADELDGLFERWRNACHGRHTITRAPGPAMAVDPTASYDVRAGRNWLIVLENPNALNVVTPGPGRKTVSTAETPQCQKLRSEVVAAAMWVKDALEDVLEQARKKGILPGMVRELRRKYRLEWGSYRI